MKDESKVWEFIAADKLSRRQLLKGAGAAGLAAATTGLWSVPGMAQEARPGGVMNVFMVNEPANFDMISNTSSNTFNVISPIYNGLVVFNPLQEDEIIGDLATDWTQSEDGLTYTFNLVQNAKWHDGQPLTAADVKATFDIVRAPPEGTVSVRRDLFGNVASIETDGDYTVTFTLESPQASFLPLMATAFMLVAPKHILDAKGSMKDDLIGSGPFKFREYIRGVSFEVERNPEYHIPDRPYLDGVKLFLIPSTGTALANVRTGNLHHMEVNGPEAAQAETEFPDVVNVQKVPNINIDGAALNVTRAPFDNPQVRLAVAYALSRDEAVQVLLRGDGEPAGWMPAGPWELPIEQLREQPGYAADREANLAEARRLLAEAGFENGFETTMLTRNVESHSSRALFIKDQLAQAGINVTLDVQESAAYAERFNARDFAMSSGSGTAPIGNDPEFVFGPMVTGHAANSSQYSSPEFDALYAQLPAATDPAERLRISNELEVLALAAGAYIKLMRGYRYLLVSKKVHDLVLHSAIDNNRRFQNVWLEG